MKFSPLIPRHSSLFILGREAELCFAELETVLSVVDPAATIQKLSTDVALVQLAPNVAQKGEAGLTFDPAWWIRRLGGTRLIARVLGTIPTVSAAAIHELIDPAVRELALSSPVISAAQRMKLLGQFKKLRPGLRYRPTNESYLASGLSERLVRRDDGCELLIISTSPIPLVKWNKEGGKSWLVAEVIAVQDTRAWTERDMGLPAPDPIAGMLPPKLARIMVNLAEPARPPRRAALSERSESNGLDGSDQITLSTSSGQQVARLLDPFCGSGQIPIEALRLGWTVTATDLDPQGVERTKKNLVWAQERSADAAKQTWTAFSSDIAQIIDHVQAGSIDAIVTEPDLGPPLRSSTAVPSEQVLENVTQTIRRAFDAGRTLIRPGGRLVIVVPIIAGNRIADRLFKPEPGRRVDDSVHSGYTLRATLHYSRPDARVERELFVFDKQ